MSFLKFLVSLVALTLATPGFMVGVFVAPIVYGFLAGFGVVTEMMDRIGNEARARQKVREQANKEKKS